VVPGTHQLHCLGVVLEGAGAKDLLHLPGPLKAMARSIEAKVSTLDAMARPRMHRMRERRDIIGFEQSTLDKAMSLKEDIYLDGF